MEFFFAKRCAPANFLLDKKSLLKSTPEEREKEEGRERERESDRNDCHSLVKRSIPGIIILDG